MTKEAVLGRSISCDDGYPARFFIRVDNWKGKSGQILHVENEWFVTTSQSGVDNSGIGEGTKKRKRTHHPTIAPTPPAYTDPLSHQSGS